MTSKHTIEALGLLADCATVDDVVLFEVHISAYGAYKYNGCGTVTIEFSCNHPYNGSEFVFSHTFPLAYSGHIEDDVVFVDSASLEWEDFFEREEAQEDDVILPKLFFYQLSPAEMAYRYGGSALDDVG
ncbi:MAG: hypothetical protein ACHP7N_11410 [Caulobacterales bacterium]